MKPASIRFTILMAWIFVSAARAADSPGVELKVHLTQANNRSPYCFVRAKFQPGEVSDPWAVRFFDAKGAEVPYFVWDSVTWQVAREGRADWGRRYALVNHAPGDSPEVLAARLGRIADQLVDFGGAHERGILHHKLLPVQARVAERDLAELAHGMRLTHRHHVIVGLILLQHQPHRAHVVARKTPVSL